VRDPRLLKKVSDKIWEFRVSLAQQEIRLFAFWDEDLKSLIICTHGFIKKKQKAPRRKIEKAKKLMRYYYKQNKAK